MKNPLAMEPTGNLTSTILPPQIICSCQNEFETQEVLGHLAYF